MGATRIQVSKLLSRKRPSLAESKIKAKTNHCETHEKLRVPVER